MQLIDILVKFLEMSRKIGKISIYWRNIIDNSKKKSEIFVDRLSEEYIVSISTDIRYIDEISANISNPGSNSSHFSSIILFGSYLVML